MAPFWIESSAKIATKAGNLERFLEDEEAARSWRGETCWMKGSIAVPWVFDMESFSQREGGKAGRGGLLRTG